MARLRARAFRLVWTAYGAWDEPDSSPNSEDATRGELARRLSLAKHEALLARPSSSRDMEAYRRRHDALRFDARGLTAADADHIAAAVGDVARQQGYVVHALAVRPDAVQVVVKHHRDRPEDVIEQFKHAARVRLHAAGDEWRGHPVWSAGGWIIPLERKAHVREAMEAVNAAA
ncbi:MAG: hypothetical protein ACLFV7_12810, partial [Phycisphaerae bacterium]